MPEAAERLVNLALYLASSKAPRTARECREAGLGYPDHQDDAAFERMFERDKDALRAAGIVLQVVRDGDAEAYSIDADATFARPVEFTPAERAAIKAVGGALVDDPSFPFREALRSAIAKLGALSAGGPLASADLARWSPDAQGSNARQLAEAVQSLKTVSFIYTNAAGETKRRMVDPYGVFFRDGSWYLVGKDHAAGDIRTFAVARASDLHVNRARPRTPDFERPADFDVRKAELLPFQLGSRSFVARLRFPPETAWRAERLSRGKGRLHTLPDGSVLWTVEASDMRRLASWIIDEGPGIHPVEPPELVETIAEGLRKAAESHA